MHRRRAEATPPGDLREWARQFGIEPTRDPADIRRWADLGGDLAVVLNDLPADGPAHPAVQVFYPDRIVTVCEATRQMLVSVPAPGGDERGLWGEIAAIVQAWGCSYMVLRDGEEAA